MELKHMLEQMGEDVTLEEVKEIVRNADLDNDGQINYEEFARMMV